MSIPGLGQIPTKAPTSSLRRRTLQPLWEWRFEVPHGASVAVRLASGTAERDGTELALNHIYRFTGTKSKLLTWRGCELEVEGDCDEYVAEHATPDETPQVSYLNLHFLLASQRAAAAWAGRQGPRVLVAGPPHAGKTSLARTLTALATRSGAQPLAVNADPREGMLALPGTLSAAVFGTVMDVESEGGGWGGTPSSGPAAVPAKLPLVYYYGRERPEEDPALYRGVVSRLAGAATARMAEDPAVRSAGMIVDSPGFSLAGKGGAAEAVELLAHVVEELSVNIVVVLGSARMNAELGRRLAAEKTSLGESVGVVLLDRSEGVVERDEAFMQQAQEAVIREYFFGDAKRTLGPVTQVVDFDGVTVYRAPDSTEYLAEDETLERVEPSSSMAHWTLAVMNAALHDPPGAIRTASVVGFVYVAEVDRERRKLKILTPVSGRLGDRPMVWGRWPEPFINLLG